MIPTCILENKKTLDISSLKLVLFRLYKYILKFKNYSEIIFLRDNGLTISYLIYLY